MKFIRILKYFLIVSVAFFVLIRIFYAYRMHMEKRYLADIKNARIISEAIDRAFFLGKNSSVPSKDKITRPYLLVENIKDDHDISEFQTVSNFEHYVIAKPAGRFSKTELVITGILGPFSKFFGDNGRAVIYIPKLIFYNKHVHDIIIDAYNNPCQYRDSNTFCKIREEDISRITIETFIYNDEGKKDKKTLEAAIIN